MRLRVLRLHGRPGVINSLHGKDVYQNRPGGGGGWHTRLSNTRTRQIISVLETCGAISRMQLQGPRAQQFSRRSTRATEHQAPVLPLEDFPFVVVEPDVRHLPCRGFVAIARLPVLRVGSRNQPHATSTAKRKEFPTHAHENPIRTREFASRRGVLTEMSKACAELPQLGV